MKAGEIYELIDPAAIGCSRMEAGSTLMVIHRDGHSSGRIWVADKLDRVEGDTYDGCLLSESDVEAGTIRLVAEGE